MKQVLEGPSHFQFITLENPGEKNPISHSYTLKGEFYDKIINRYRATQENLSMQWSLAMLKKGVSSDNHQQVLQKATKHIVISLTQEQTDGTSKKISGLGNQQYLHLHK